MAIFNSYVKLPKGIIYSLFPLEFSKKKCHEYFMNTQPGYD